MLAASSASSRHRGVGKRTNTARLNTARQEEIEIEREAKKTGYERALRYGETIGTCDQHASIAFFTFYLGGRSR